MQVDYQLLGKRIAALRKEQGYTQEALAERAGMTNVFLSNIENCRSIPSLETLMKLCGALSATPDQILLGTQTQSPDYLNSDILRKLERCTPQERRLVDGFLELLARERNRVP